MSAVVLVTPGDLIGAAGADLIRLAAPAGLVHHVALDRPALESGSATLAARIELAAGQAGADVVVLAPWPQAPEVGALLAHRLAAGLVWEVAALRRAGMALEISKRVLGGTWDVTARVSGPAVVLAAPAPGSGPVPEVSVLELPAVSEPVPAEVEVISREMQERTGVALSGAGVVVAGGRGLEGDLGPVRDLADALGAAVGATRDIVEEGWIGGEAMVGQTGTMIAPRLYIGAGISGAPHHVLGMRAADSIVAINLDPDAPLMEIADLAVVGDAAEVLTQAAALVRARRGR